jgi:tRNA-specific 2-thiouridylase
MSGGVDSSVAAHLLLEQGHEVIGVFMRHGSQSPVACGTETGGPTAGVPLSLPIVEPAAADRLDRKQGCCTAADAADAQRVADRLGVPFYALNLDQDFQRIIDYFVEEYAAGRTPNPCVQCNNWIKFGKLFAYADAVGAEFVATGHYARLASEEGEPALYRGVDAQKDQSYVLFGVDRAALPRMLLPVGGRRKADIRRLAADLGLRVADKQDSQEICFVTRGRYDRFVRERLPDGASTAGDLVLADGAVVGRHAGIEGFTVGQRKGLGVALGSPKFVVRIEADTRRVVLGDRPELHRRQFTARRCSWLVDPPTAPASCLVQIRYNAPAAPAEVRIDREGALHVAFAEPQFGVAPGQAAVCYREERVLGGGWIEAD